ncbi:MAG: hypothetical protein HYS18_04215 [Burkholderiales bacterium]|nr:hypothetical protein [Burkholderiales bacterium]
MTQNEALLLIGEEAEKLERSHVRQNDLIFSIARIVSSATETLSQESIEALILIGAFLYKGHLSQIRARADIAQTMTDSMEGKMQSR